MIFDFSFTLVAATGVTGMIWGLDAWLFKPRRVQAAVANGVAAQEVREPVVVEYARSFFPVILIVLLIRSFLFEPFRIPSASMMPTLLKGDFIFVNKYTYGLRLPVVNRKIVPIGEPKRGDVIVFRLPKDPSVNYIKRLVGLPGDHISVSGRRLYVNGKPMPVDMDGPYQGPLNTGPEADARLGVEDLDGVKHNILYNDGWKAGDYDDVVPPEHYFFMGDNRDNSRDSRFDAVGFVPAENLVGKAVLIWFNWDRSNGPIFKRIGNVIQ